MNLQGEASGRRSHGTELPWMLRTNASRKYSAVRCRPAGSALKLAGNWAAPTANSVAPIPADVIDICTVASGSLTSRVIVWGRPGEETANPSGERNSRQLNVGSHAAPLPISPNARHAAKKRRLVDQRGLPLRAGATCVRVAGTGAAFLTRPGRFLP